MNPLKLVIGNRNYSSWSLRAWLYLKCSGIEFEEVRIPLFTEDWAEQVSRYSPAGRVPILLDGELAIWDSLAIMGHIRETRPEALDWPEDPSARARARSISAEMHSGFFALRDELPQNLRARTSLDRDALSSDCRNQVGRVMESWNQCREQFGSGGPWLFGDLSIADIMYAPVVLRFRTYGIDVTGGAADYARAVCKHSHVVEWCRLAAREEETLDFIDQRTPSSDTELVLG